MYGRGAIVGLDPVGVAPLPARFALGELLVELPGIEHDQPGQLGGAVRAMDRTGKAFADEHGQQTAVVQMGVGQHDRIQLGRLERERNAVADSFIRAALEHAAVDEDLGTAGFEQELRPGDGRRAAQEVEVHTRMVPPRRHRSRGRPVCSGCVGFVAVR